MVLGLNASNLRNDPRTTAIGQYQDLQLLNGLMSGDPGQAASTLQQLAQMNPAQLLMLLKNMDPAMFQQLALAMLGAAMMGSASSCGCGGGAGGAPLGGGVPMADAMSQGLRSGSGARRPGRAPGMERPRAPAERNVPTDQLRGSTDGRTVAGAQVYPPRSPEAIALFREAARVAGVPESWASSPALHNILARESGGVVGRPNYTYGSRANDRSQWGNIHAELRNGRITARSSATGLGQLLLSNVDRYYPAGRAGIGDPVQEAAGMLRYIKARYGSPEVAWARYNTRHEGY